MPLLQQTTLIGGMVLTFGCLKWMPLYSFFPWPVYNPRLVTVGSWGQVPGLYISNVAWKAQYRWLCVSIASLERPLDCTVP